MSEPLVLAGGNVVTADGLAGADVRIDDGLVTDIGRVDHAGARVIDSSGAWVGPGFVDLHTHLREPGHEWKEDVGSGSRAAAAGGYTAIVAMANTDPPIDSGHLARFVQERGREVGRCEIVSAGCITSGRAGERLAHLDDLWAAGVRIFSDDGDAVADAGLLRRAMDYLAPRGGIIAMHAEDPGLARDTHMHEGEVSSLLGMAATPAAGEEVSVARDLALVALTGCRYHLQHVSTAGAVELVRRAKAAGLPVTAEATPHHFTFDHYAVKTTDPAFKMRPPLRTAEDVEAVRSAVVAGVIDVVATDHAPHAEHEKEVPFEEAPFGVIGLETAAAALTPLGLEAPAFFDRLSVTPARIGGIAGQGLWPAPGTPANLVVFRPEEAWTPEGFQSKSRNSPFAGMPLRGRAAATMYAGTVTWEL